MRRARWIGASLVLLLTASPAWPQPRGAPPAAPNAASSGDVPVQCWWRPAKGAIHVGEILDVTLTCSALESDVARAVVDEARLTVAAVQMAPWEIVGGTHPADTRAGSRRLFQYVYQLRMLDANAIGRDVKLPPLAIPYRVQSRMGAEATVAGRDLTHVMPQIPIRVVGQVSGEASDIRDGANASLGEIAALRFRANAWRTGGTVVAALGAVTVIAALLPLAGRLRTARTRAPGRVSDRAVLAFAAHRLAALAGSAAGGWTPDTLRNAHAAARLVAASLIGGDVRQRRLERHEAVPEGRLLLTRRFGRTRTAVTASTTAADVTRALDQLSASAGATERATLERLRDGLAAIARAQYDRPDDDGGGSADAGEAVRALRDIGRDTARQRLFAWRPWRPATPSAPAPVEF